MSKPERRKNGAAGGDAHQGNGAVVGVVLVAAAAAAGGAVAWLVGHIRRRNRYDVEDAWLSRTGTDVPEPSVSDLDHPLRGVALVVAENVPLESDPPTLGGVGLEGLQSLSFAPLAKLEAVGVTVVGRAKVDPLAALGPFPCMTTRTTTLPPQQGRLVMGASGALSAIVSSGGADAGLGIDSLGGVLLPAACLGLPAYRATKGLWEHKLTSLLHSSGTCAAPALVARDLPLLGRMCHTLLKSPGQSSGRVEDVRVLLAVDMFALADGAGGEQVNNGVITRSLTSWMADRDDARSVNLLAFLAKDLTDWEQFTKLPKTKAASDEKAAEPVERVLDALWNAAALVRAREVANFRTSKGLDLDALPVAAAEVVGRGAGVADDDYEAALVLMGQLAAKMEQAIDLASFMVVPLLAGAAPRLPRGCRSLSGQPLQMAELTLKFTSVVASMGCPCVVLPVPPVRGVPWAVALIARHKSDYQLVQLAVKLGAHIGRMAEKVAQELAARDAAATAPQQRHNQPEPAADNQQQAEQFKQQGNAAFRSKKYAESVVLYTAALQYMPGDALLHSNRAMAHLKLQDYTAAYRDCTASLELRWTVKAALRRGTAAQHLGRLPEALEDFQAVLKREPNNTHAREQASECMAALQGDEATFVGQS